jgi:hypothetical protein
VAIAAAAAQLTFEDVALLKGPGETLGDDLHDAAPL